MSQGYPRKPLARGAGTTSARPSTHQGVSCMSPSVHRLLAGLLCLAVFHGPALAQTAFPTKPIELVVPYPAGGGTDVLARAFAQAAVKHLPQPFVVVNKPGAAGAIGWADVLNG